MITISENKNVAKQVWDALESGCKHIRFIKGKYDFYPEDSVERYSCILNHNNDGYKRVGVQIENKKDIIIDGNGSDFMFHGTMLPFGIENSCNVKLCNFSVDYPASLYVHSTVVDATNEYCDIKIWDCTSYKMVENTPMFLLDDGTASPYYNALDFNTELECVEYGTNDRDYFENSFGEELGDRVLRLRHHFDVVPKIGNHMFIRTGMRYASAIFINFCENIDIENVTIHNCHGMGLLAQMSKDIKVTAFVLEPSGGRFVSAYADGMHFVECSGEILIDSCRIQKQMDDSLNCHGIYARIDKIDGPYMYAKLVHDQQRGVCIFEKGDTVQYIDRQTLKAYGKNTVINAELTDHETIKIELENDIDTNIGDCIENISHVANLTVRNCYFGKNRARGLLITSKGRTLIENNTFERAGAAVRISGDCNFWFESGAVSDITIRNNTFIDCNANSRWGRAVIDIAPEILGDTKLPVHKNICIQNNVFRIFDIPQVWANCADGIVYRDNITQRTNTFTPKGIICDEFTAVNCTNVFADKINI